MLIFVNLKTTSYHLVILTNRLLLIFSNKQIKRKLQTNY
jgi:hypothetical protein